MNKRAIELEIVGRSAYHDFLKETADGMTDEAAELFSEHSPLIAALAAMLAAPAATKAKPERPKLAFTAQQLHAALKDRVSHIVVTDLVNGQAFGAANKKLHGISGLTPDDLPRLIDWIEAGGLAWMTQSAPTFQLVAYKIEQWLNNARDWDRKGRQAIGKAVQADQSAPDRAKAARAGWRK
jgi:hypothetical protein